MLARQKRSNRNTSWILILMIKIETIISSIKTLESAGILIFQRIQTARKNKEIHSQMRKAFLKFKSLLFVNIKIISSILMEFLYRLSKKIKMKACRRLRKRFTQRHNLLRILMTSIKKMKKSKLNQGLQIFLQVLTLTLLNNLSQFHKLKIVILILTITPSEAIIWLILSKNTILKLANLVNKINFKNKMNLKQCLSLLVILEWPLIDLKEKMH